MLDLSDIRRRPDHYQDLLARRMKDPPVAALLELDKQRREAINRRDGLRKQRNDLSKQIGKLKAQHLPADDIIARVGGLKTDIAQLEKELKETEEQVNRLLYDLPNLPEADIPASLDPEDKVELRRAGEMPHLDFPLRDHVELGRMHRLFDFERGAKIAKSFFPLYYGTGALLERSLLHFMMDRQRAKGYVEIIPPHLANRETLFTSGQLPKFADDLFACDKDGLYLIPTSEVPLVSFHRGETLDPAALPKKYFACTPCYRREAGAWGKDNRGLIRVHQFNKIELAAFCRPEHSEAVLQQILTDAEAIVKALGLHYRVCLLSTGDLAHQSAKTYDIEVFLPSLGIYKEISSCSNCTDFQARRGNIRYRREGKKNALVHTLNGSGLATSRLMVALLEQNQQKDGTVIIPDALRPYMGSDALRLYEGA